MIKLKNNKKGVKIYTKNKVVSMLLILIMTISIFKPVIWAVEAVDEKKYGDWTYCINDNEVTITGYSGEGGNVSIPEKINSLKVTNIGEKAFYLCYDITGVTIPEGVTNISHEAFYECINLKNIEIPNSVVNIGVTAFYCCTSLTELTIPGSVKKIENAAFFGCSNLTKLIISEGVTSIEEKAFTGCDITNITIPDSLEELGMGAFADCQKLTSINVKNSKNFSSYDGILYNKEKTKLIAYPAGKKDTTFNISNSVKSIEGSTFEGCKNLTKIKIPEGITTIKYETFFGCSGLTEIILPESITTIEGRAFDSCKNLTKIKIPEGVTTIEYATFFGCYGLTEIKIPEGVTTIKDSTFGMCTSLTNVTIPNSVTIIERYAFHNCDKLTEITIPESVTEIGECVFQGGGLTTIYGYKGSCAEKYADENNFEFKSIGEYSPRLIEGDFYCGTEEFSGDHGFKYSDEFFEGNANEYNHHLATMSLCLAYSAYNLNCDYPFSSEELYKESNLDCNVKDILSKCKFENYKAYNYDKKPTSDNIACAMASKKLPNDDTLIAIAVRGGGYESEWAGNFNVGYEGNHAGFESAGLIVYDRLIKYIQEMKISGNIKIWITGFSRAAATSNMCAAKLIDDGCGDWFGNVSFDKNDIYAYCFATPAGADKSNNPNSEKYNSIFNIVHYYDPVPLVAPAYWDFDRYGRTYIFPFSGSLKDASIYEKNMLKRLNKEQQNDYVVMSTSFKGEAGSQYIPTTNIGVFLRKCIKQLRNYTMINNFKIYKPIESRAQLIESGWQKMLIDALISSYSTSGEKDASDIILEHLNELIPALNCIDILLTANAYKEYLALVHAEPDFYLAWMQSMDSNYVSGADYKFTSGTGRLLYINCPVDVFIYDSNDNLVASIIDDVPNDIEITTSIDENGQKIVYLPTDEDYTIKTVAREDCKTTITIEEYTGVSSIVSKIISYSEIEMKEGEEVIATATKYDESESNNEDESGAIYTLNMSDKTITPDISISEDKVEDYTYVITAECNEEQGTVIGGGIFNMGEFCQVTATSNPGYIFDGWYIGDNKVSNEETYRFAVKENDNLKAKFNREEKEQTYLIGDINGDEKINIKDWNMLYSYINETVEFDENQLERADINGDGKVNIKDWNRLYNHITEVDPLL